VPLEQRRAPEQLHRHLLRVNAAAATWVKNAKGSPDKYLIWSE
jgi:hypothetical protein